MPTTVIASPSTAHAGPHPEPAYVAAGLDVAELYAQHARHLQAIVRLDVRAADEVVEDACAVAWARLIPRAGCVRRHAVLTWLAITARREAIRLTRRECLELSLEAEVEAAGDHWTAVDLPSPHERTELRERLALTGFSERQRRLMWLRGVGLGYEEIAAVTGDSPRTIERQLIRARRRARELG